MKFFRCEHCGNIIAYVKDSRVNVVCCGQPMTEMKANTTDASVEKHVPTFSVENNILTVTIGSVEHPMTTDHYIEWVAINTTYGNQRKMLMPNTAPTVKFALMDGEEINNIFAYCNLHGLWSIK
jgi:superoxide reductase